MAHACGTPDAPHDAADPVAVERPPMVDEQQVLVGVGLFGAPRPDQFDGDRVQGQVAVVVQLADRYFQPVGGADAHHGVGFQPAQLPDPEPCAGEDLHDQAVKGGCGPCCPHERGRCGVVQEPGQRVVDLGQVGFENGARGRRVGPAPFDGPLEEHPEHPEAVAHGPGRHGPTLADRAGPQPGLVSLDVASAHLAEGPQCAVVADHESGEAPQGELGSGHRRRAQREGDLVQVPGHGRGQLGRPSRDGCPAPLGI